MLDLMNSWRENKKKKALHFFNENFKRLSHFPGKAKRFTEPGETKHKPDHGLNHSFQAQSRTSKKESVSS